MTIRPFANREPDHAEDEAADEVPDADARLEEAVRVRKPGPVSL